MSFALYKMNRNGFPTLFGDSLFDSVFDSLFNTEPLTRRTFVSHSLSPQFDVRKINDDNFSGHEIAIAAPGVDKGDIDVSVKDGVLSVSYNKKQESDNGFSCSAFSRSWTVPDGVNVEDIAASYKQVILTLKVPTGKSPTSDEYKIEVN